MKTPERKLICVVEDDPDIRLVLSDLLEQEGYEVRTASNGREALELLNHQHLPADLILLDLMMPIMNGQEFLQAADSLLRSRCIPVVVMTAGILQKGVLPDLVKEQLRKPLNIDTLLESVSRNSSQGRIAA